MLKNTHETYGWLAKVFHWVMALAIVGMFGVAYVMTDMEGPQKSVLYGLHKSVGVTLLGLLILRLLWRLASIRPDLPDTVPGWQRISAHANILLLYALMFTMTISGFFMSYYTWGVNWFGLITFSASAKNNDLAQTLKEVHEIASYIMIASVSLHVVAALYHHFILKDSVLRRIWR
ncbi:MAG: cytochrome b [Alphaproteobacteria bacterium]|jgi:cytochrome b561|nr:cytochrome b [Alphaproteobacteria bacterium]